MKKFPTPLRYPGGKTSFTKVLVDIIEKNNIEDGIYVEPYAGGAGAALKLFFEGHVERIALNDKDTYVYSFWKSILNDTDEFIRLIKNKRISMSEWYRQRGIIKNKERVSRIEKGFAFFYMNRCNRSGIINSGPIGGHHQSGEWKLDARYKKNDSIEKIERISEYRDKISINNFDALTFLKKIFSGKKYSKEQLLIYVDPPYYVKGHQLYMNFYNHKDHAALAELLNENSDFKWVLTYDDVKPIRDLYKKSKKNVFYLNYYVHKAKLGKELLISSQECKLPAKIIKTNFSLSSKAYNS